MLNDTNILNKLQQMSENALMYAIKNKDIATALSLITEHDINFDVCDNDNKNVLMYALE